ncbi:MAG: sigma 54-interacting transcriptional regulator, partial [Krumholzibacteria bacterium]|nr:sigma 54-interacting transcriptional regulator [Candidatus Krumholzibacteria bacterium]
LLDGGTLAPGAARRAAALLRGWCLIERRDHGGCLAWLDAAERAGHLAENDLGARILRWNVLMFHEHYADVEEAVMAALPPVAAQASVEHAELRLLLGAALRWRGRLADAVEHVEYACAAFTVLGEPGRSAVAANFLGWTCLSLGRLDEARRWFEKALALNMGLGARLRMAQNYQNLAIVCYKQGDYGAAVELLEKELVAAEERPDMTARARIALGNVLRLQGRWEEARRQLTRAHAVAAEAGLAREQTLALEFLGDVHRDEGRPAEARRYYERGMAVAHVLAPRGDLVMELRRREGECLDLEGRHEDALAVLNNARELCDQVGDAYETAVTLRCLAVNAANLGRWPLAARLLDEALLGLRRLHARHEQMVAAYHAARFRLRWADTGAVASRASALLEEAWNHALVAHRLDQELEGTPLAAEIAELVAELVRRRVGTAGTARPGGTEGPATDLFSARRAPCSRVVAFSPAMRQVLRRCDGFARYDGPVLLLGESGTGKELLAHRIHETSPRSARPLLTLNCATAPGDSLARELFGAVDERGTSRGLIERARGGTLLLTSVETLPEALQERLLLMIRDGTWRPLGSSRDRRANVRLIATSARDLAELADRGRVRPDLYFRLRLMTVAVPPLRQRPEDVVPLLDHFLTRLEGATLAARTVFDQTGLEALATHDWPGNGIEVESIAQQAWLHRDLGRPLSLVRRRRGDRLVLEFADLAQARGPGLRPRSHASGMSWETLNALIARAGGNKARAARQLGVSRVTLYRWLSQLDPQ